MTQKEAFLGPFSRFLGNFGGEGGGVHGGLGTFFMFITAGGGGGGGKNLNDQNILADIWSIMPFKSLKSIKNWGSILVHRKPPRKFLEFMTQKDAI